MTQLWLSRRSGGGGLINTGARSVVLFVRSSKDIDSRWKSDAKQVFVRFSRAFRFCFQCLLTRIPVNVKIGSASFVALTFSDTLPGVACVAHASRTKYLCYLFYRNAYVRDYIIIDIYIYITKKLFSYAICLVYYFWGLRLDRFRFKMLIKLLI